MDVEDECTGWDYERESVIHRADRKTVRSHLIFIGTVWIQPRPLL